jgi:hypothetical protein
MSLSGPGPFGVAVRPVVGGSSSSAASGLAEARLALTLAGGTLVVVYAVSGATLLTRVPWTGGALLAVAALQAGWLPGRDDSRLRAAGGFTLNICLAGLWVLSRASGLPFAPGGPQPVGVLDAIAAADSLTLALLALGAGFRSAPGRLLQPVLTHAAILLSVATLASLAGGHTHAPAAASGAAAARALYCRLF